MMMNISIFAPVLAKVKITWGIIAGVFVNVMWRFFGGKVSANNPLANKSMLGNILSFISKRMIGLVNINIATMNHSTTIPTGSFVASFAPKRVAKFVSPLWGKDNSLSAPALFKSFLKRAHLALVNSANFIFGFLGVFSPDVFSVKFRQSAFTRAGKSFLEVAGLNPEFFSANNTTLFQRHTGYIISQKGGIL